MINVFFILYSLARKRTSFFKCQHIPSLKKMLNEIIFPQQSNGIKKIYTLLAGSNEWIIYDLSAHQEFCSFLQGKTHGAVPFCGASVQIQLWQIDHHLRKEDKV